MIYDDYETDVVVAEAKIGVDSFLSVMLHVKKVEVISQRENQLFVKRIA